MKRKIVFVLLVSGVLALAGCGGASSGGSSAAASGSEAAASAAETAESEEPISKPVAVEKTEEEERTESEVGLANPFVECRNIEGTAKVAGFEMTLPELPKGYDITSYRAMEGSMMEVIAKNADKEIRLRKAAGTEDASGDYNEYQNSEDVSVGDITVTEKGNDDGVHCAVWTDGEHAYSITSDEGLSSETVAGLVTGMMG